MESPQPAAINAEYRISGIRKKSQEEAFRAKFSRMMAPRVLSEVERSATARAGELKVQVDQHLPPLEFAQFMATVYSAGLIGSDSVQYYDIVITYTPPSGTPITRQYRQSSHLVNGLLFTPKAVRLRPIHDVREQLVEDVAVNFLCELQREDPAIRLACRPAPTLEPQLAGAVAGANDKPVLAVGESSQSITRPELNAAHVLTQAYQANRDPAQGLPATITR